MVLSFYPKHEKEYQSMSEKEMMQQMQDTIIKLLDQWQKKKARDQER